MQAYELAQLISQRESSNKLYLEFLKVPDLSMGVYVLPAGGTDPQSPHTEDEVYYVVSGRAKIMVAEIEATLSADGGDPDFVRSLDGGYSTRQGDVWG